MSDLPPQVAVDAHDTGDRASVGSTNAALQLASSLAQVAPEVNQLGLQIGSQLQESAAQQAHADALSTHGEALADAVRKGKLEPTQNPWYMTAYKQDVGLLQGKQQITQLLTDSQSWAERTDPAAYQRRFESEVGKLSANFTDTDAAKGFQQAAQPLMAQAFSQNQEYAVQNVIKTHTANVGSLMTTALMTAAKAHGGVLLPADAETALAPFEAQWKNTGGQPVDYDQLKVAAITGAAEQTKSAVMMDLMKDVNGSNGQPLASLPGVADEANKNQHYIAQAQEEEALRSVRLQQATDQAEGYQIRDKLLRSNPEILLSGKPPADLYASLIKEGHSAPAIAEAFRFVNQDISQSQTLSELTTSRNTADPAKKDMLLKLWSDANTGVTDDLQTRIASAYRNNDIDYSTSVQLLNTAKAVTRQQEAQTRAEASQERALASQERQTNRLDPDFLDSERKVKGKVSDWISNTVVGMSNQLGGRDPGKPVVERLTVGAVARANGWLAAHPKDYAGAVAQAKGYLAAEAQSYLARAHRAATTSRQGGGPQ